MLVADDQMHNRQQGNRHADLIVNSLRPSEAYMRQ